MIVFINQNKPGKCVFMKINDVENVVNSPHSKILSKKNRKEYMGLCEEKIKQKCMKIDENAILV